MLSDNLASGARRVGETLGDTLKDLQRRALDHLSHPTIQAYIEGPVSRRVLAIPGCLRLGDPVVGKAHPLMCATRAGGLQGACDAVSTMLAGAGADELAELHGFAWIGDLKAVGTAQSAALARLGVAAWIRVRARETEGATAPGTVSTRVRNCLAHADLLLADCDAETFDATLALLDADLETLERQVKTPEHTFERLSGLMALVLAGLVVDGRKELRETYEDALFGEIAVQVLPDGGHISRDATRVCETLLDLVPLLRMYGYLSELPPPALVDARGRLQSFLRSMRVGSARFAGFSGLDAGRTSDDVNRLLKLDPNAMPFSCAEQSGYARIEHGPLLVVADVGAAPPVDPAARARVSLGAIELSHAGRPVIVCAGQQAVSEANACDAGMPSNTYSVLYFDPHSRAYWQTPNQQTNEIEEAVAGWRRGSTLSQGANPLERTVTVDPEQFEIAMTHRVFAPELGLCHARRICIDGSGSRVTGEDRLYGAAAEVRFARDVPFSIHFHVAEEIKLAMTGVLGEIQLTLGCGAVLLFRCQDSQVGVQPSRRTSRSGRTYNGRQIVVRGTSCGETTVSWQFELKA